MPVSSAKVFSAPARTSSSAGDALIGAGALLRIGLDSRRNASSSAASRPSAASRVLGEPPLALDIRVELDQALVELGDAFLGARFLAFERLAGDDETLQGGGGADLGVAQRRQLGGGLEPGAWRLRPARRCAPRRSAPPDPWRARLLPVLAIGGDPAQMEQRRLGLANLLGDDAVADRLLAPGA